MDIKFLKSDKILLLIFYLFAVPISMYSNNIKDKWPILIQETFVYVLFSLLAFYLIVYKAFPYYFSRKKYFSLFVIIVALLMLLGVGEVLLYKQIGGYNWDFSNKFKVIMFGLESSLENTGILLGVFLGKKFFDSQLDLEKREKQKKESELKLLKSQIDPHFLFNNLNALDSLIDSDPKVAKNYLNRLAQLYRYLIQTKDDEVVSLQEELNFAKNYVFLLENRYGNSYQFKFSESFSDHEDYYLPPAALQVILENVVKHNTGSELNPIITHIDVENETISIKNNINLKLNKRDSNGIGLDNLKSRYKLLSDKKVNIEFDVDYKISLPLLKSV